jgi:hypothetical protein
MTTMPSIFAQIVDRIRLMNEEQQKLLWLQLNQDSIYAAASKVDSFAKGKVSMDEIAKLTRHVRLKRKKT